MAIILGVVFWQMGEHETDVAQHCWHGLFDLYLIGIPLALLRKKVRRAVSAFLLLVTYFISFFEIFLLNRFDVYYTPTILNLWQETNGQETREFFSSYFLCSETAWVLTLFLAVLALHGFLLFLRSRLRPWKTPWQTVVRVAIILLVSLSISPALWEKGKWVYFFQGAEYAEKCPEGMFYAPCLRLVYSFKMLHYAEENMADLRERMCHVSVDSCTQTCPHIVLVIGESFSKIHAQLYNYAHKTTPHMVAMRRQGNLFVFQDAVTPWNLTSRVFKNLFSTAPLNPQSQWTDGVLFPALMRKGGYQVAFWTNQFESSEKLDAIDFNGSFFLNDPQISGACFDHRNKQRYPWDMQLIEDYINTFAKHTSLTDSIPTFTIFHLYGQHTQYSCRFEPQYKIFTADSIHKKKLTFAQKQMTADYDNATLYNDAVFERITQHFQTQDAIIIYLSDHGEEVYDHVRMFGRSPGDDITPAVAYCEFRIPFVIWTSSTFKEKHPDIVQKIRESRRKPFISCNLAQIVLGLAGVHSQWYDAKRDLLSDAYQPGPRLLKGTTDYDNIIKNSRFDKNKHDTLSIRFPLDSLKSGRNFTHHIP